MERSIVIALPALAAEYETPAQCKKRVGSARECFSLNITGAELICNLRSRLAEQQAEMGDKEGYRKAYSELVKCGSDAKKNVRPFYDKLVIELKERNAAQAVAKKSLSAFIAIMNDPPGTRALSDNLKSALAELEVEVP